MGDEIIHPGGLQGRRLSGGSAGPALQGEGPFADPDQADGGGGADSPPTATPGVWDSVQAVGSLETSLSSEALGSPRGTSIHYEADTEAQGGQ